MARLENRAAQLVRDTKAAIVHADRQLAEHALKITKVELELRVATVSSGGAGISFELAGFGADLGGDHDLGDSTAVRLSMVPDPEAAEHMSSAPEDFVDAIVAISAATAEAAAYPPQFALDGAVVTFDVDVTNKGEFKFIVRGSRSRGSGSTMAITLAPA
jgi:hypothetical protein